MLLVATPKSMEVLILDHRLCYIQQVLELLPPNERSGENVQYLIYVMEKLFNINLGYKFRLLAKGPYSRKLFNDLKRLGQDIKCRDELNYKVLKEFIKDLNSCGLSMRIVLKVIATYVMFTKDVYPRPKDVIKEVSKICRLKDYEVQRILSRFRSYLIHYDRIEA